MENFVLNLFADQLSKIILDFHRTEINANFLSGKGSITNVKLNVGLINDFLNKPPHGSVPQLEFTEILLTELRVEVTSYTNLKRAPIVLVIEEIHATAREPLEYHVDPKQQKSAGTAATKTETAPAGTGGKRQAAATPQQYGLLHRILDNLSIRIKRINLSFSPLGKFKTRRHGPWTPPTLNVCFDNVELISVTETGQAGTPEQVWAHNELGVQQSRFRRDANQQRHRSYVIYKRFTMEMSVKLPTRTESKAVSSLLSNTNMEVHIAYVRRLKDAGVSGVDVDVLVEDIDINLDVVPHSDHGRKKKDSARCDLGAFVHMLVGLLHCYYKDRSFVDPLLPDGFLRPTAENEAGLFLDGVASKSDGDFVAEEEDEILPDDFLPEVEMVDDESTESEFDEEDSDEEEKEEAYLSWKEAQEGNDATDATTFPTSSDNGSPAVDKPDTEIQPDCTDEKAEYKRKRKAVIVIASGAQKFEKLSFSLTLPRIAMKLCLPSEDDDTQTGLDEDDSFCLELLLEGMKAESIWPKSDGEMLMWPCPYQAYCNF